MRRIYSLLALCALFLFIITPHAYATDYTYGDNNNTLSYIMPLTTSSSTYTSISQQLFLASDLTGIEAEAGDITALTFYYGGKSNNTDVRAVTRNIEIYISAVSTSFTEFEINSSNHRFKFVNPGTKVYDGAFTTEAITAGQVKTKKITFSNSFAWDGTKNIVITMFDKTNSKFYSTTDYSDVNLRFALIEVEPARFIHIHHVTESSDEFSTYKSSLAGKEGETYSSSSTDDGQRSSHRWVNRITFSISATIPVPTSLAASSVTASTAHLSWGAVTGATGYNVQWGTNSANLDHSASNVSNTYLDIDELQDGTTYYFAVQTITAGGTSAYSDAASFNTTAILHEHDGISFSKWNSANSLPSSVGNYYLSTDVVLPNHYTVPGNINLCLNGHNIYTDVYNIVVPDEKTLTIYDNVGGGRIYGYYVGTNGSYYGLISVDIGGTFVLNGGSVENLADQFNNAGEVSYGIYNNGTLKLSGAPAIIGYHGDIYLASSKYVTIESGKPLTNTTPYSLFKLTIGPFTIGWENMGGAKPSAHFIPKNEFHGVCYNSGTGEAEVVRIFSTSDNNASIKTALEDGTYRGTLLNFKITSRSFTSAQYNTICLPFALSNAQLADVFGAGYDLEEFASSSLEDDVLSLTFNKVSSLVAGKPYLLKPSVDVANPVFDGVTFYISEPVDQTSDANISFHGTFAPTALESGNQNILFLGADNELFWPAEGGTNTIKGFRAYFEVKGGAAQAAKRARIVVKEDTATGMESIQPSEVRSQKILRDGQLIILRGDKEYNVQGQVIK